MSSLLFGNFVKERVGADKASIDRSECRERNWTLILLPFNLLGSMMIEINAKVESYMSVRIKSILFVPHSFNRN